jgi:uncharacterized membrane protein YhhN
MQLDIGLYGVGLVILLALAFGIIAQLIVGRSTTRWLWLIGAIAYFVGAILMSEVLFATATIDEIQPIMDGLAFDEALLGGLVLGTIAVAAVWLTTRRSHQHRPATP